MENSYRVSLAGLYFCGLTEVTLLNAGYRTSSQSGAFLTIFYLVIFFILFIVSPSVAKKLWIYLVIYAELVTALLYTWEWSVTEPWQQATPSFIGLRSHDVLWIGIIWNIIIMLFSAIQWHLNKVS